MINEREMLILNLKRIRDNKYELNDNEKVMDFVKPMLKYVGDTDPELRDDLIYVTFCTWICEKEYLSNEQLSEILATILDEKHLFFNIGHDEDDTVFTRTFSVLLIDVLLWRHRNNPYLDMDQFTKTKVSLIKYYNEEKDLRGYLDNKGWAHGAAHGADAICELAQSKDNDETVLMDILKALQRVLCNGKYFLSNEEDERMTRVIFKVVMEDLLPKQIICDWIESLPNFISLEYSREQYTSRVNIKNFIRCIYFSLMRQENTKDITDILFKTEGKVNRFI